jgi:hypothetical protein
MSKVDQIEQALKRISGAKFQQLCDTLLYYMGNNWIKSYGTMIGKEKVRRGTPDSYIPLDNGNFIFVEYTTQERLGGSASFYNKLSEDIDSCFNEEKSKIEVSRIEGVVLCFTDRLSPSEYDDLRNKCSEREVLFDVFDIDRIKNEILKYPVLAKDFLEISLDTHQILKPSDFISEYEKGLLSTTLHNSFYFREEELQVAGEALKNKSVLLISGKPGVGKSRFALEVMRQFCENHSTYEYYCIANKTAPLYEDARAYFNQEKDLIIFIDDANKAINHLKVLLSLLHEKKTGQIKIIATVRDYALPELKKECDNYSHLVLTLNELTDDQIKTILTSNDFGIKNRHFLDRICSIALGNPRLAIMAAKVALKTNKLESLVDASKIYEDYYSPLLDEIPELKDKSFLKVLGIISFLGSVSKMEVDSSGKIVEVFGVSKEVFWEKAIELHNTEVVDLFENEVVKISDQILGTYFFYEVFIKRQILDLQILLVEFFESHEREIRNSIIPIANTFGFERIKEQIDKQLDKAWEELQYKPEVFVRFLVLFSVFKPRKTIAHLNKLIQELPKNDIQEYVFEEKEEDLHQLNNPSPVLEILRDFHKYTSGYLETAIELSFELLEKHPLHLKQYLKIVSETISFERDDNQIAYHRQRVFFGFLIRKIRETKDHPLYRGFFYHIVNSYLKCSYRGLKGGRDNTLQLFLFNLPSSEPVKTFRKTIWEFLIEEFNNHREKVLTVFFNYIIRKGEGSRKELWEYDSKILLPFIEKSFDLKEYLDCKVAQEYFAALEAEEIQFDKNLGAKFTNLVYQLSLTLNSRLIFGKDKYKFRLQNPDVYSYDKLEEMKKEELEKFCKDFTIEDFKSFWEDYCYLYNLVDEREKHGFTSSLAIILDKITFTNPRLGLECIKIISHSGFGSKFRWLRVGNILNNITFNGYVTTEELYNTIDSIKTADREDWKLEFFRTLEESKVNQFYSSELLKTLNNLTNPHNFYFSHLDFLRKYSFKPSFLEIITSWFSKRTKLENRNIFTKTVSILLEKNQKEDSWIVFGEGFITKQQEFFSESMELLEEVYLNDFHLDKHFDIDSSDLKLLLDHNNLFAKKLLEKVYDLKKREPSYHDGLPNLDFIWERNDFKEIIDGIMEFGSMRARVWDDCHFLNKFFKGENQKEKKLHYLKNYLLSNPQDKLTAEVALNIAVYSFNEELLDLLKLFLVKNSDFKVFQSLKLVKNETIDGDLIANLENRKDFWQSVNLLLEEFPSQPFRDHRLFVEEMIEGLDRDILRIQRREFRGIYRF